MATYTTHTQSRTHANTRQKSRVMASVRPISLREQCVYSVSKFVAVCVVTCVTALVAAVGRSAKMADLFWKREQESRARKIERQRPTNR